ncbi:MAG: DEAD/DEAH box helicase, partial [Deltaproteobacteria bacterium]|nr:DEAD/DEAH box helicase [Deltaproteobacteria bacterium]
YSPKCGSGNKPLDKNAALLILEALTGVLPLSDIPAIEKEEKDTLFPVHNEMGAKMINKKRICYFDLETQKSAEDVGGWQNAHLMMISVAVVFDSLDERFYTFTEDQISQKIR